MTYFLRHLIAGILGIFPLVTYSLSFAPDTEFIDANTKESCEAKGGLFTQRYEEKYCVVDEDAELKKQLAPAVTAIIVLIDAQGGKEGTLYPKVMDLLNQYELRFLQENDQRRSNIARVLRREIEEIYRDVDENILEPIRGEIVSPLPEVTTYPCAEEGGYLSDIANEGPYECCEGLTPVFNPAYGESAQCVSQELQDAVDESTLYISHKECEAIGGTSSWDGNGLEICVSDHIQRSYASQDPQQCHLIDLYCEEGSEYFSDDTGCGCER